MVFLDVFFFLFSGIQIFFRESDVCAERLTEGRGANSNNMQGEMGDGKIQLTNEKLIGNGSFGVVFQVALA